MITDLDYKIILDNFSSATLVASPVFDSGSIIDFTVEYTNQNFLTRTEKKFVSGMRFSEFSHLLSTDIQWFNLAEQTLKSDVPVQLTIYSPLFNCWFRFIINHIPENFIVLNVYDVTQDKEYEQQLRQQNLRLASMTDELSMNKTILKNKLNSIEALNEQLQFSAYHDTLTNLFNRAWFNACMTTSIQDADKNGSKFGLLLFDIDDMKNINDSRGHKAGDDLIRQLAATLRRLEKPDLIPFRFGGDEFILLVKNLTTRDTMITIGDTLLEVLNNEGIKVSGGISLYPDDSTNAEELLKYADMAMYEVKKNHKNSILFFHQIMQEKFLNKVYIGEKLSTALDNNSFQLYFQPQFDASSGILRGFEALLRWYDPELGWVSPEQFIPLAEESRLVIPLGTWVLETAVKTLKKWETDYNFNGIMSVNVSPVQLQKPDFLDILTTILRENDITPEKLEIEITEGVLIDNMEDTVNKLKFIRSLGIGISLDDFGTGYSSLRYLQILPLTTLKIDKSFIASINSNSGIEANITNCIVSMVTNMGLDTIAEGVETDAQLQALQKINCKTIQGFLKGKPMPADLCERVLKGDTSAILTITN